MLKLHCSKRHSLAASRLCFSLLVLWLLEAFPGAPQKAFALGQSTGLEGAAWPTFRESSAHSGRSGMFGSTTTVSWIYEPSLTPALVMGSPVIATGDAAHGDGVVYYGDLQGALHAIDELTGVRKWEVDTGSSIYGTPAVAADGTVYFGNSAGLFYEVDGGSGFVKKQISLDGTPIFASPTIDSAGNIFMTTQNAVYKIQPFGSASLFVSEGSFSTPAVSSAGTIVTCSETGTITATSENGAMLWQQSTNGSVESSPAIATNGNVYVGSDDGNVYALNGSTGAVLWSFATSGEVESSPAIGPDGTVYVGSNDGNVYALNGASGTLKWAFPTADSVFSSPAVASDSTVYVGSDDGNLYGLNGVTGGLESTLFPNDGPIFSSPAIGPDGGLVYVPYGGVLYELKGQQIAKIYLSTSTVTGGQSLRGVIQVASPAGPGGDVCVIRCNDGGVTVPSTVTIPAGTKGASFPITTSLASTTGIASVEAILGDATATTTLVVNPYAVSNFYLSPPTVTGGQTTHGVIQLAGPAGPNGIEITLNDYYPNIASVPKSVTIPAGKTGISFAIPTFAVTGQESFSIFGGENGQEGISTTITVNP